MRGLARAIYNRGSMLKNGVTYASSWREKLRFVWGVIVYPAPVDYMLHTWFGDFHYPDIGVTTFLRPTWEKATRQVVSQLRESLFVDVGANVGIYSVLAAKNGNRVLSVEPSPRTYRFLRENLRNNHVEAETWPCAAWDESGYVDLEYHPTSGHTRSEEGGAIRALTLDNILSGRIPRLVKIDVEGSELRVLKGMTETLDKGDHLEVIFEAWNRTRYSEIERFLKARGYGCRSLDRTNFLASR